MLELAGAMIDSVREFDCAGCGARVLSYGMDHGNPPLCGICWEVGPHNKKLLDAWQANDITVDEFKEQWNEADERARIDKG